MSGAKRITVDEAAWRDAQAAAAQLRTVNRQLPSMIEALNRQQEERVRRATAEMQAQQDALSRSLTGLSEQTARMEKQLTRRIQAKTDQLRRDMTQSIGQLRDDTRRDLQEQELRLQADLEQERQERERDVQVLRDSVAELSQDRRRVLAAARNLVADDRLLLGAIDAELPHERYAPGRLAQIEQRLALAEQNVAAGVGEAALSQAQDLFLQLGELRAEVELKDQQWRAAQVIASMAVSRLEEQIRLSARIDTTDAQGNVFDGVALDVDFWSEGELSALRERAEALAARVSSTDDPPSAQDLRTIAEQDVPGLDAELTDIVGRAGARQYASQVRVNLAELVVNTLEDVTGFVWVDNQALYEGEDPRRAFYSKLRHPDDSEIVVEVAPDDKGESFVLRILSQDAGIPDESERVRRVHAIADRLRDNGLMVSSPTAEAGDPDPAEFDFDAIRRPAPAQQRSAGRAGAVRREGAPG